MSKLNQDYVDLVNDILNNTEYLKLKKCEHHGLNRYQHCLKVSIMSYELAKKLNYDYKSVARAGLLHDFFTTENVTVSDKFKSFFNHPLKALENSKNIFELNELEEDIIKSHMFPTSLIIPKYKESWLVSLCDKYIASKEFFFKFGYQIRYATNLTLLVLINFIK